MQNFRVFTSTGRVANVQADSLEQVRDEMKNQFPDQYANGVIIRDEATGQDSYVSEGYATSDPERIAEIAQEGYAPREAVRQSFYEGILRDNPLAARIVSAGRGIPFIGEYLDEASGMLAGLTDGPEAAERATEASRTLSRAMQERRPVEAALTQAGVGIGASLPVALATAPAVATSTVGGTILRGAGVGAALGGTEGLIAGYGAGEGEDRARSASERGLIGGVLGGALGAAVPAIGAGIGQISGRAASRRVGDIAEDIGIEEPGLRVLAERAGMETPGSVRPTTVPASLAETSAPMRQMLDVTVSSPGVGATVARENISQQAAAAAGRVQSTLDDVLGRPTGILARQRDIMADTAAQRGNLYNQAYSRVIDYTSDAGDELRRLLRNRIPDSVIRRANQLMEIEGVPSRQRLIQMDEAGNIISSRRMPDVRQFDYIKRALDDQAVEDAASPNVSRAYRTLSRELRETLDRAVPEYRAARSAAAEAIGDREAVQTGADLFRRNFTAEDAREAVRDMTEGELLNVRAGVRQYIQDQIDNVLVPLDEITSEAGVAARNEALEAIKRLIRTEASQNKLRAVLGDEAAERLINRLRDQIPSLEAAAVGGGSATQPRQALSAAQQQLFEGGLMQTVREGDPFRAAAALPSRILSYGARTPAEQAQAARDIAAPVLSRQMAPDALAGLRAQIQRAQELYQLPLQRTQAGQVLGYQGGVSAAPVAGGAFQRRESRINR